VAESWQVDRRNLATFTICIFPPPTPREKYGWPVRLCSVGGLVTAHLTNSNYVSCK